jgi:hypothetical protein
MHARCNGFRIRGCNADCDRLAVQSSEQTTWLLGRSRWGKVKAPWHDVGIGINELIVLRPYGGSPVVEIEALGDKAGLLIIQQARGPTRSLRVGARRVIELDHDEACVIRCEWIAYPHSSGVAPGAYGPGLRV